MEKKVFVVDCRSRAVNFFSASVTTPKDKEHQMVLRHSLEMGMLFEVLGKTSKVLGEGRDALETGLKFSVNSPILIMGEYKAFSSSGHVSVLRNNGSRYHRDVVVVGELLPSPPNPNKKGRGLKVLGRPVPGVLLGGKEVEVSQMETFGNSNCTSEEACAMGVKFMAEIDEKSVFVMEGQSDRAQVGRFSPSDDGARHLKFPVEHRSEMFRPEEVIKRVVCTATYHFLSKSRTDRPTQKEVREQATRNLEVFLAEERGDCLGLGRELSLLHPTKGELERALTLLKGETNN